MSEEKETKKEKEKIHKLVHEKLKKSGWKIATVALLALLIISMFTGGFKNFFTPLNMGKQKVSEEAVSYINANLLQPGTKATLNEVTDEGDLYKLSIKVGTLDFQSYVSKDGKYLFPSGIDLTETVEELPAAKEETPVAQDVPKTDKPVVQAFIFSYCPYGLQFEKALLPVYKLLKSKANIELLAIGAMHGEYEKQESLRQVCIESKYGKDKLWSYLEKFNVDAKIGACGNDMTCSKPLAEEIMTQIGVDKTVISDCVLKDAEALYKSQNDKASALGIGGSPTFVINGANVQVARSPEAIKKVICDSFNTPPAECSQTLSTTAASPGFGAGTSTSAGSC
jgi:hypothetical protein